MQVCDPSDETHPARPSQRHLHQAAGGGTWKEGQLCPRGTVYTLCSHLLLRLGCLFVSCRRYPSQPETWLRCKLICEFSLKHNADYSARIRSMLHKIKSWFCFICQCFFKDLDHMRYLLCAGRCVRKPASFTFEFLFAHDPDRTPHYSSVNGGLIICFQTWSY